MMAVMRNCDVLVTANQYGPADPFTASTETFPFFCKPYLTMPFSVTGQPAMTMPCGRSEEHTSEIQSLMRTSYAVFSLKKKNSSINTDITLNPPINISTR